MTDDERHFQEMLDADPTDAGTRLVFADWLQEQGDERAAGYRAMGYRGLRPNWWQKRKWWWPAESEIGALWTVPDDWFGLIEASAKSDSVTFFGRREAEDAAALAFARLPLTRQAELLAGLMVPA